MDVPIAGDDDRDGRARRRQVKITNRRDGTDYTAVGEYLEVDSPRRLVYTFSMPQFSPNSDTITIDIAPDGAGSVMTFTHSGIDIAAELSRFRPAGKADPNRAGNKASRRSLRCFATRNPRDATDGDQADSVARERPGFSGDVTLPLSLPVRSGASAGRR